MAQAPPKIRAAQVQKIGKGIDLGVSTAMKRGKQKMRKKPREKEEQAARVLPESAELQEKINRAFRLP